MILCDIQKLLEADVLACQDGLQAEVKAVKASDLMSDVLTLSDSGILLLTGLTNVQAVRTAEIAEIAAIIFVRGKRPDENTIQLAEQKKIPLLATRLSMFESCGLLYTNGLSCVARMVEGP